LNWLLEFPHNVLIKWPKYDSFEGKNYRNDN